MLPIENLSAAESQHATSKGEGIFETPQKFTKVVSKRKTPLVFLDKSVQPVFFSLIPKAGLTCSKHNQKKLRDKRSSPSPVEPQDVLSEIVGSSPPQLPWLTGDFLLTATNRAPGKCARAQLPVTFLQFDMFQPCIFKKRQFRKKKSMAQPCQLPSLSILNKAEIEQFK